jgi:hypothetical protein
MGFSGGGSNILKPHTHDSTILQDGGNLDFKNITQSDMSAGSVTYSDGVHLQELGIGTPAQQLIVNPGATAPVWSSEHEQGRLEILHDDILALDGTTMTYTPSSTLDMETTYGELVFCLRGWQATSGSIGFTINGHANYAYTNIINTAGTLSGNSASGVSTIELINSGISGNGSQVSIICSIKRSENGEGSEKMMVDASGGNIGGPGNQITTAYCGSGFNTGDITELEIVASANMDAGMCWTVWGRRIA